MPNDEIENPVFTVLNPLEARLARDLLMTMPGVAFKVTTNPTGVGDLLEALAVIKEALQSQFTLVEVLKQAEREHSADLEAVRRVFGR